MTASNFDEALKRVLVHEGGYANHPQDPGGATMKGVTQRVYDGWRRRQGKALRSVRQIDDDEIKAIYRAQYWDTICADALPSGVDYCTFDAAVNSGPSQAAKWLQRTVGVPDDGGVGPLTIGACKTQDPATIIDGSCDRRMAMLRKLPTFRTFGAGWTKRVADVRSLSKRWANNKPLDPVITAPPPSPAPTNPAPPEPPSEAAFSFWRWLLSFFTRS